MGNRIVWQEGMALSPHHFQQQELFFENQEQARRQFSSPFLYGLSSIEVDIEALGTGVFFLNQCSGIFPDGTLFRSPQKNSEPVPRSFADNFTAEKARLGVYLGVPALAPSGPNLFSSDRDGQFLRFSRHTQDTFDINTGANPRPVDFGRLNLKILFEGEILDGFQTIKISELVRTSRGTITLDNTYIPPLLQIGGSGFLLQSLKKLIDFSAVKSDYLMDQRSLGAGDIAMFTSRTLNTYLFLSAIHQVLPELRHLHAMKYCHPEVLFSKLLAFCGAMLTFTAEVKPQQFPIYSHEGLKSCFTHLFNAIHSLLNAAVPAGHAAVPLSQVSPVQYTASLREIDSARPGQFYLGITAQAPEAEIAGGVQRNMKIGPPGQLDMLVNAAMPGISLVPEQAPPGGIPAKQSYQYFRLVQSGSLWDEVLHTRALSIHMPAILPGFKLELTALTDPSAP